MPNVFDFTLKTYRVLLESISSLSFRTFEAFVKNSSPPCIILRHDVDRRPEYSLRFAEMQHALGICSSYYFRIVAASFSPNIIERIAALGHEIGYHYENLSTMMNDERRRTKGTVNDEGRTMNLGTMNDEG